MKQKTLDQLNRYEDFWRGWDECKNVLPRMTAFIVEQEDCFERTHLAGHVTGSAIILTPDYKKILLTHHRKLNRWLQLGGHADGDANVQRVAFREGLEESGLTQITPLTIQGELIPVDIDIHTIPERKNEPEHEHFDIRFPFVADGGTELNISDESNDLRFFDLEEVGKVAPEASLIRQVRKVAWLRDQGLIDRAPSE